MLKTFILTLIKVVPALPLVIGVNYGLLQIAELTNFKVFSPGSYMKLINVSNWLLWLIIEQWIGYIIFCVLSSFIWVLLVEEPKKIVKIKFNQKRKLRLET
jgi:hypothetical protein